MSDEIFREQARVERQLTAMGMAHFDIAIDPRQGRDWYFHRDLFLVQLKELLPKLWEYNRRGYRILIRPHGEHGLTLLDGLDEAQIRRLGGEGLEPAAVIGYGEGLHQVWLKHDRKLNAIKSQAAQVMLYHLLEMNAKGHHWDEFGLLAGFELDRKPVQLVSDDGQPFSSAARFDEMLK